MCSASVVCPPSVWLISPPSRPLRSQVFHSRRPASGFPSRLPLCRTSFPQVAVISGSFFELAARCFARPTHTLQPGCSPDLCPLLMSLFSTVTMDSASNFRTFWAEEVKRREKKGGEKTVLSFGQPLQPRRRGGCLSKPKNHHQLTCKAILHHHDRLFKRPQGFL